MLAKPPPPAPGLTHPHWLLQTKKRYVGFMYESPGQQQPTFDAKVRSPPSTCCTHPCRSWCPAAPPPPHTRTCLAAPTTPPPPSLRAHCQPAFPRPPLPPVTGRARPTRCVATAALRQPMAAGALQGIETVRRDSCPAVSKMLEASLRLLFATRDVSRVKAYVTRQWSKMLANRVSVQASGSRAAECPARPPQP